MLSPPLASTFDAEVESTLPKASALVETVQLAVTVALVARLPLAVPAIAGAGRQITARVVASAPLLRVLNIIGPSRLLAGRAGRRFRCFPAGISAARPAVNTVKDL